MSDDSAEITGSGKDYRRRKAVRGSGERSHESRPVCRCAVCRQNDFDWEPEQWAQ